MRRRRKKVPTGDPFVDRPKGGAHDEGEFTLERLRKMKRLARRLAKALEEWEREIVSFKRRESKQKGTATEIAILHEMYDEASKVARRLEQRAEKLEGEE